MITDYYDDMDQNYKSSIFRARKQLLESLESSTLLPFYGLNARGVLTEAQLDAVKRIRERKTRHLSGSLIAD